MKKAFLVTTVALAALTTIGCYDPHAHDSKIVRDVEAAGSGDLTTYTYQGLVAWFVHRPELAKKVDGECTPLWASRDAAWFQSAEGTTCHAARVTAPPPELTADQRAW